MKSALEKLIIGALLEFSDDKYEFSPQIFQDVLEQLLKKKSILSKIPKRVIITNQELEDNEEFAAEPGLAKDIKTNFGDENYKKAKFYKQKGILLHDGLHASAFGRMNYIYRSKGVRIYLFRNSTVMLVGPYTIIDHNGFQFVQEKFESYKISEIDSYQIIQNILQYCKDDFNSQASVKCGEQLIKMITGIKEQFNRYFFLEYVLNPPDVDRLSEFSKDIRYKLWKVCLANKFKEKWGEEMQENAMSFLAYLQITPSPLQVLEYVKKSTKREGFKEVLDRIELLEKNILNKPEDVFEFKPNISGIGINFNEIYKRLTQ